MSALLSQICDIDPFTDDYFESKDRCQRPIPDRVNNVEKTEMDLLHMLRCKYANGDTVEYRACNREGTMGILGSSGDGAGSGDRVVDGCRLHARVG